MDKSTISMAIFDSFLYVYQRVDIQISRISICLSIYIYLYLSICDDLCGWGMGMRFREMCLSAIAGMGQRFV